jgi:hypothetical protein
VGQGWTTPTKKFKKQGAWAMEGGMVSGFVLYDEE